MTQEFSSLSKNTMTKVWLTSIVFAMTSTLVEPITQDGEDILRIAMGNDVTIVQILLVTTSRIEVVYGRSSLVNMAPM